VEINDSEIKHYSYEEYMKLAKSIDDPDCILKVVIENAKEKDVEKRVLSTISEHLFVGSIKQISKESEKYWDNIAWILYVSELEEVPLHINDPANYVPEIAAWRLQIGR